MGYKIKKLNLRLWSIFNLMPVKRIFILFTLLTLISVPSYSQLGGSSTYNFLQLPVSARAAALGGYAITTRDGDLSTAAGNPSFLDSNA